MTSTPYFPLVHSFHQCKHTLHALTTCYVQMYTPPALCVRSLCIINAACLLGTCGMDEPEGGKLQIPSPDFALHEQFVNLLFLLLILSFVKTFQTG